MRIVSAKERAKEKRKQLIVISSGILTCVVGVFLLAGNSYRANTLRDIQGTLSSEEIIKNNQQRTIADHPSDKESTEKSMRQMKGADVDVAEASVNRGLMDYDSVSIPTLSEVRKANRPENRRRAMQAVTGTVSIPSVAIKLNILEGTNATNMLYGATTMLPHQVMGKGNYVLAGHNMKERGVLFSNLILNDQPQVHKGNRIYLSNGRQTYTYRVTSTETIDMHDTNCLNASTKPIITLFTCTKDTYNTGKTKYRFVVHGELLK